MKYRYLGLIGAIVTIAALGTSLSTQQAVSYSSQRVPGGTATAFRAQNFTGRYFDTDGVMFGVSMRSSLFPAIKDTSNLCLQLLLVQATDLADSVSRSFRSAMLRGLWTSENDTIPILAPSCSTTNCTWQTFYSIGYCHKVANVTQHVMVEHNDTSDYVYTYTLPGQASRTVIEASVADIEVTPSDDRNSPSLAFDAEYTRVGRGTGAWYPGSRWFIFFDQSSGRAIVLNVSVIECILYPCVQKHDLEVTDGVVKASATDSGLTMNPEFDDLSSTPNVYFEGLARDHERYILNAEGQQLIKEYISNIMNGTGRDGAYTSDSAVIFKNVVRGDAFDLSKFDTVLHNIATSLSNT